LEAGQGDGHLGLVTRGQMPCWTAGNVGFRLSLEGLRRHSKELSPWGGLGGVGSGKLEAVGLGNLLDIFKQKPCWMPVHDIRQAAREVHGPSMGGGGESCPRPICELRTCKAWEPKDGFTSSHNRGAFDAGSTPVGCSSVCSRTGGSTPRSPGPPSIGAPADITVSGLISHPAAASRFLFNLCAWGGSSPLGTRQEKPSSWALTRGRSPCVSVPRPTGLWATRSFSILSRAPGGLRSLCTLLAPSLPPSLRCSGDAGAWPPSCLCYRKPSSDTSFGKKWPRWGSWHPTKSGAATIPSPTGFNPVLSARCGPMSPAF